MVPFGCTGAPYYYPDPRCPRPATASTTASTSRCRAAPSCTPARRARVVDHASLGPAYGDNPVLLRNRKLGWDLVIGHTRKVFVEPGDRVHRGDAVRAGLRQRRARRLPPALRAARGRRAASTPPSGRGRSSALSRCEPSTATYGDRMAASAVLRNFLDDDGRLHTIPTQARQAAGRARPPGAVASSPGRRYPEPEVNEILGRFHPDHAALRRYLVENQFLTREDGVYWRSGGTVDV